MRAYYLDREAAELLENENKENVASRSEKHQLHRTRRFLLFNTFYARRLAKKPAAAACAIVTIEICKLSPFPTRLRKRYCGNW